MCDSTSTGCFFSSSKKVPKHIFFLNNTKKKKEKIDSPTETNVENKSRGVFFSTFFFLYFQSLCVPYIHHHRYVQDRFRVIFDQIAPVSHWIFVKTNRISSISSYPLWSHFHLSFVNAFIYGFGMINDLMNHFMHFWSLCGWPVTTYTLVFIRNIQFVTLQLLFKRSEWLYFFSPKDKKNQICTQHVWFGLVQLNSHIVCGPCMEESGSTKWQLYNFWQNLLPHKITNIIIKCVDCVAEPFIQMHT